MSVEKGQLSIHTENFLPIIKKWLYSDRDIFVRELVSNCCDAVAKRRMTGETPEDYSPRVTVRVDKEHRILSFTDDGVGMTAEEVRKYINQVAFSGANDFLEKYKDSGEQIIGHFGLGFYSAFMVADKVRIDTLSCMPGEKAVTWESDGSVEYTMEESEREEVGTTVTLYLNDESDEFLDGFRMKEILRKYCSFMPTPIYCEVAEDEKKEEAHEHEHGDGCGCEDHEHEHEHEHAPEMLNTPNPLYLKAPKDCTEEEYKKFYRDTFHEWEEPLFWIHLNADYPFNLHGILYFPRLKNEFTANEGQVKLYSNQVFIADNIKEIIPEFLLLLKGVVDCPDLPLNVSRSFLQNDGYVRKLSDYITRKVADRLTGLFKNEREQYETYWKDIHPFIKYGCLRDEKFYDRMKDAIVYKTSKGEYETLQDYLDKAKDTHAGKVYYANDEDRQANTVGLYEERGIEVLVMGSPIDISFMQFIESKNSDVHFARHRRRHRRRPARQRRRHRREPDGQAREDVPVGRGGGEPQGPRRAPQERRYRRGPAAGREHAPLPGGHAHVGQRRHARVPARAHARAQRAAPAGQEPRRPPAGRHRQGHLPAADGPCGDGPAAPARGAHERLPHPHHAPDDGAGHRGKAGRRAAGSARRARPRGRGPQIHERIKSRRCPPRPAGRGSAAFFPSKTKKEEPAMASAPFAPARTTPAP